MGESFVRRFSRLLSRPNYRDSKYLWQDREIRFDLPPTLLTPRSGERKLASLDKVEDIKGTKFEPGTLIITNLRVLWVSSKRKRLSISIGAQCITDTQFEEQLTRHKGGLYTIQITTRYSGSNFQFVFSCLGDDVQTVFELLQHTYTEYRRTRIYRDLAIRDLLMKGKELVLLKGEDVMDRIPIVFNLSCEQANEGLMFITNLRVVWNSSNTADFNISMPYIQVHFSRFGYGRMVVQMKNVQTRESRFGPALVIEIVPKSGGYVMGFSFESPSELERITTEIKAMKSTFEKCPILDEENETHLIQKESEKSETEEESDEGNGVEQRRDVFTLYCTTGQITSDATPVFNPHLGVAIEPLPESISIQELWNVI